MLKGFALGFFSLLLFIVLLILGPFLTIHETVLKPEFVTGELDKTNLAPVFQELLSENLPAEYQTYSDQINRTILELEPWIKEQANNVILVIYKYISGETDSFNVQIPLDYAKQILVKNLTMAYIQNPPPGTLQLSQNDVQQKISKDIQLEGTLEISDGNIGKDIMNLLQTIRQIYYYVNLSFILLIALGILFIVFIVAVIRDIRKICLSLGLTMLIAGILTFALYFVFNSVFTGITSSADLPEAIQPAASTFSGDILKTFRIYGLIVLVCGFVLFITFLVINKIRLRGNRPATSA